MPRIMKTRILPLLILLALMLAMIVLWPDYFFNSAGKKPSSADAFRLPDATLRPGIAVPIAGRCCRQPLPRTGLSRDRWNASLDVTVLSSKDNKPIEGVVVRVYGALMLPPLYSDENGRVRLHNLAPGAYEITAFSDRFSLSDAEPTQAFSLKEHEKAERTLALMPACVASGRLIGARSLRPLSGARVYPFGFLDFAPVVTGVDGRFELSTGNHTLAEVTITAKGYTPRHIRFTCIDGRHEMGDVALVGQWTLSGRVTDGEDQAQADVVVNNRLRPADWPAEHVIETVTDEAGRFELSGLPGIEANLYFRKDGFIPRRHSVSAEIGKEIEIGMTRECIVHGQLVDQDDAPIRDAVAMNIRTGTFGEATRTDPLGRFSSRIGNTSELFIFERSVENGWMKTIQVVACAPEQANKISLTDDWSAPVRGQVLTEDGQPAAFASVYVSPGVQSYEVLTDESGAFECLAPNDGDFSLIATSLNQSQTATLDGLSGEQSGLEIRLSNQREGAGKVALGGSVQDTQGRMLSDYEYCWGDCLFRLSPDAEGRWSRIATDGHVEKEPLWVFLPDGRLFKLDSDSPGPPDTLTLTPGAGLRARFGEGFSGVTIVRVYTGESLLFTIQARDMLHLPRLPEGDYRLMLSASNGRTLNASGIRISGSGVLDLGTLALPSP